MTLDRWIAVLQLLLPIIVFLVSRALRVQRRIERKLDKHDRTLKVHSRTLMRHRQQLRELERRAS